MTGQETYAKLTTNEIFQGLEIHVHTMMNNQLEDRYIYTESSAWRPVKNGTVTIFKPVMKNRIVIGACPLSINLKKVCTADEMKQLVLSSKSQAEYEAWYNDQLKMYQGVAE